MDIIPFEGSSGVPAHLHKLFAQGNSDLTTGLTGGYPIISYKGKTWHIIEGEKKTLVTHAESEDPAASLEVVILKANPHLSKLYYERGYEEGSSEKPTCYSNDSKTPALDAQVMQATSCAACPHNVWGSRITEGGSKGKACTDLRRMAVAPVGRLDGPMLLRVPAASLKELAQYAGVLDRRKAPYQAVVTKISFDTNAAHPQFLMKPLRWVTEEEANLIAHAMEKDIISQIIGLVNPTTPADALGDMPAHVRATPALAAPTPTTPVVGAPRRGRPPKTAEAAPTPTAPVVAAPAQVVARPEIKKPATVLTTDDLLSEADSALDEALAELDD